MFSSAHLENPPANLNGLSSSRSFRLVQVKLRASIRRHGMFGVRRTA